jgi:hypothetical protein
MSPLASSPQPGASGAEPLRLADLRGLRTSPALTSEQRQGLRQELQEALAAYPWFTIGVLAPSPAAATACLRRWERALGWEPLAPAGAPSPTTTAAQGHGDPATTTDSEASPDAVSGVDPSPVPVFLKGNQRSGTFFLRQEEGLGEGVLVSGQNADQAGAGETWGPLPLDLF